MHHRVVQEKQGLRRHCGGAANGRAGIGIRPVEEGQKRMPLDALRHQVHAAAVVLIGGHVRAVLGIPPSGGRRERMPCPDRQIQVATRLQDGIPGFFRTQTAAGEG